MNQFTSEQIQTQFAKLPKELQAAISSAEIHEKVMEIGRRHNLMIDQIGDLVDQIGLVILGLARGSNFVTDLSKRLLLSPIDARIIANEVNSEVLSDIRTHMRKFDEQNSINNNMESKISSVENAGDFKVEKAETDTETENRLTSEDRSQILDRLENPPQSQRFDAGNTNTVSRTNIRSAAETLTEPLPDHLLQNAPPPPKPPIPIAPPVPQNLPTAQSKPEPPTSQPPANDPYKEPLS